MQFFVLKTRYNSHMNPQIRKNYMQISEMPLYKGEGKEGGKKGGWQWTKGRIG